MAVATPGDIPGADRCRQGRHESVEGLDFALASGVAFLEEQPEAVPDLAPRHELQAQRQEHSRYPQHAEHGRAPGEGVDRINQCVQPVHRISSRISAEHTLPLRSIMALALFSLRAI